MTVELLYAVEQQLLVFFSSKVCEYIFLISMDQLMIKFRKFYYPKLSICTNRNTCMNKAILHEM